MAKGRQSYPTGRRGTDIIRQLLLRSGIESNPGPPKGTASGSSQKPTSRSTEPCPAAPDVRIPMAADFRAGPRTRDGQRQRKEAEQEFKAACSRHIAALKAWFDWEAAQRVNLAEASYKSIRSQHATVSHLESLVHCPICVDNKKKHGFADNVQYNKHVRTVHNYLQFPAREPAGLCALTSAVRMMARVRREAPDHLEWYRHPALDRALVFASPENIVALAANLGIQPGPENPCRLIERLATISPLRGAVQPSTFATTWCTRCGAASVKSGIQDEAKRTSYPRVIQHLFNRFSGNDRPALEPDVLSYADIFEHPCGPLGTCQAQLPVPDAPFVRFDRCDSHQNLASMQARISVKPNRLMLLEPGTGTCDPSAKLHLGTHVLTPIAVIGRTTQRRPRGHSEGGVCGGRDGDGAAAADDRGDNAQGGLLALTDGGQQQRVQPAQAPLDTEVIHFRFNDAPHRWKPALDGEAELVLYRVDKTQSSAPVVSSIGFLSFVDPYDVVHAAIDARRKLGTGLVGVHWNCQQGLPPDTASGQHRHL